MLAVSMHGCTSRVDLKSLAAGSAANLAAGQIALARYPFFWPLEGRRDAMSDPA